VSRGGRTGGGPSRLARPGPAARAANGARARRILAILSRSYPDAAIALRFRTPLELLVATILSAQCTDDRVNLVTAGLFEKYRSAEDWARVDLATLEREIHSTGFYRAKARAITAMARALVDRHGGEVPRTLEALMALPGVGRKTANVVLGNAFGVPALAVDTHVARVSQRLGLAASGDVERIHDELCGVLPRPRWTQATHLLITHGRRTCLARRPACGTCAVRALCPWPGKTMEPTRDRRMSGRPVGRRPSPVRRRAGAG
jgi:endonuclease-3